MGAVGVGLLGCGAVGSAVARRLGRAADVRVAAVAVRRPELERSCPLPDRVVDDPLAVVEDASVDVVVEVMGPLDASYAAVSRAIELGKPVVTANKALLAAAGPELRARARAARVPLRFEAAVGGGVPVVGALEALAAGDRIVRVEGVLNGTVTFVLSRMEAGDSYEDAVLAAKSAGYAEADPSRDLSGLDAADKVAVLAQLAFGTPTSASEVDVLGIDWLRGDDIDNAAAKGKRWRLVGVASAAGCRRVEPVLFDEGHPFARLGSVENAVAITTEHTGTVWLSGFGAGGEATATAVVGDLASLAVSAP
ncbi:MAG: homoserine dehydrogenase [Acidimicrobiaceae bacterium]|nr:homoserine dehydrogenase [Acidimicrobiaceae bacterium]